MSESVSIPGAPDGANPPSAPTTPTAAGAPTTPTTPATTGLPEWLPAEYGTKEAFEAFVKSAGDTKAAYTQAQQKLASLAPPPPAQTPTPPTANPLAAQVPQTPTDPAGSALLTRINTELGSGGVQEATITELSNLLQPIFGDTAKQLVSDYLEMGQGKATTAIATLQGIAGGPEKYAEMTKWVATNLPQDQVAVFNSEVTSGDMAKASAAIQGAYARYQLANPAAPQLVTGLPAAQGSSTGYTDMREAVADMKDPKYGKDFKFTQEVEQKVAAFMGQAR